ncbi:MAG: RHS repeat-associated core domain-containing protein [Myxococcus sp.]|nr:RHS repeat-associated core domain-containing protein [Myxococcus sp.]
MTAGATTFAHDTFGNRVRKTEGVQVTQYVYDGVGGLLSATLPDSTRLEYVIDARGRRVGKKRNGVLEKGWLYDGQLRIVAELDGAGAVVSRFVYGSLSHSPDVMVRGGVVYRHVHDLLGSVRLVIDTATGQVAQRLDYDAWGVVTADSRPGFQPFGFAGGLYDADTRLSRFGARDYDAATGRWMSKDPIFFAGDSNRFAYALSLPTHLIDRTGNAPDGIGSYWDTHAANVHTNTRAQNITLGVVMAGAAAVSLFALEGLPWIYTGVEADTAWASLSLREKLLYEIGQKTLSKSAFESVSKLAASSPCELAVAKGTQLVATQGWIRAMLPSLVSGQWSATMGTGATPAVRAAFETLSAFFAGFGAGAAAGAAVGASGQ